MKGSIRTGKKGQATKPADSSHHMYPIMGNYPARPTLSTIMTGLRQIQGQRHLDIRMHLRSRFYYPSRTPDEELVPAGGTDFETLFWVRDKAFAGPSRLVLSHAMHIA